VNIQQSIDFIETRGSSLEKVRLHSILQGTSPPTEVTQGLFELQNADGGFPFGLVKGNMSTLNETTVALWWMEEMSLLSSPAATRAFAFMITAQQADGSWDEDPQIAQYDLPPWIELGDLKTRLYLSAYASYWLANGGYTRQPAFRKALHFLLRNQDESGKFFGYLHTTWIATAVFLMAGERYAKISTHALQALSDRDLSEWADSQMAWAMDCLSKAGLPGQHPFVERCIDTLLPRQKPDGSWASEDGEASAVSATIQVLKVLKRYGLLVSKTDV
jgi:squalene cyclase